MSDEPEKIGGSWKATVSENEEVRKERPAEKRAEERTVSGQVDDPTHHFQGESSLDFSDQVKDIIQAEEARAQVNFAKECVFLL